MRAGAKIEEGIVAARALWGDRRKCWRVRWEIHNGKEGAAVGTSKARSTRRKRQSLTVAVGKSVLYTGPGW